MSCLLGINSPISITGDCGNTNSGAFSVDISGDAPAYTITWISGSGGTQTLGLLDTNYTVTGLSAGTYTFNIIDSCIPNNTYFVSVNISSGTCVSITGIKDTTCSNDNGSITAQTQYLYSTNATFDLYDFDTNTLLSSQISPVNYYEFNGLSAGTYYVIGDDGGGCTGRSESCIVKGSSGFKCDLYVINNAGCNGTNAGAIYVTNLDGLPPYTFSWNNGETTQNITGLTSGSYSVTITDSSGCQITETGSVIDVQPIGLGAFITTPPTCFNSDGEVTVIITGGTGPYYYSGSNGDTEITFSTSYTFSGLGAGYFTVEVKDAGLCSFTSSTTLLNPAGFSIVSVVVNPAQCSVDSGSICVDLITGTFPIQFTLTDSIGGTTIVSVNSPSWCFDNLEPDTYTINISVGTCSYTTGPLVVTNLSPIDIDYNLTGTTCNECNGSIELVASGSTGPYTFGLTGQLDVTGSFTSYTFNNLCPGSYVGSITGGKPTCKVTTNILIPTSPTVNFSLYGVNPTAYSNNGTITTIITDGTPPFTLNWSPNVGTELNLSGLSAGTYSLTITDNDGCVQTNSVTLTGYKPLSNYQIYPICSTDFDNSGLLLTKGIKQMLNEGFYDLTSGDTNCILNESIFTAAVTVNGGSPTYEQFYTGITLNDYPTTQEWVETIENILTTYGVTGVTYDIKLNTIKISTPCNVLSGANIKVDLLISYDISCVSCSNVTPTPTVTPTNTPTPTPIPSCSCPSGYVLLPDGVTCEEILEELATPPLNPRIIGVNYEDYPATYGAAFGLIVYEEITNKGWPIFGLPNVQSGLPSMNSANPSSLSIIPVSGYTNQGVLYTSLSPSSAPNSPHASLNYPTGYWPVPYPPTNNPPNTPNLALVGNTQRLSYLAESFVSSGVLNLGSGSSVNIEYNRYDPINLLWGKSSVSGSWPSQVGVWSDAPSPPNTNPIYELANTWIGITECVEIPENKKYYMLVNTNNALRISINGLLAVELNNGDGTKQSLAFANCFPITLSAGTSIINVEGGNYIGGGNLAFELLDIPIDDLLSATTYSSIEPYVIFSTKQKRPRAFDINFISGSTTITSSGNFLSTDVGAFIQFPSFVYSGTYITQVIDSNTAIINSGATSTGLGVAGVTDGPSTGRIYFIFDTGQLFASGLPQGFTCPSGYTYVNCGGPTCLSVSRVACT